MEKNIEDFEKELEEFLRSWRERKVATERITDIYYNVREEGDIQFKIDYQYLSCQNKNNIKNKEKVKARYNKHALTNKNYLMYGSENIRGKHYLRIINSLEKNKKVLSLGCGAGREVKLLVKNGHEVTAVDFSIKMIDSSKKVEPHAEYYCVDAVEFINKNREKYDYIIGIGGFINHLDTLENREQIMRRSQKLLNEKGEIIFTAHFRNDSLKDIIKILVAPLFALNFGELNDYSFGDSYDYKEGNWFRSHSYTKKELENLFEGFRIKFNRFMWNQTEIRIRK